MSDHVERLTAELKKVPEGTPYILADNWPEISKLLKEGTPFQKRSESL